MKNNSLIFKSPIYIGILLLAIIATAGITLLLVKSSALFSSTRNPSLTPTLTLAPTETSTPTQTLTLPPRLTPTKINLSNIDLSDVFIKPGDLPITMAGGKIYRYIPQTIYINENLPYADSIFFQEFVGNDEINGGVKVLLYQSFDDLYKAYNLVVSDLGDNISPVSDVGEMATSYHVNYDYGPFPYRLIHLVYVRCNALVDITSQVLSIEQVIYFGKRLDERLQSVFCQPGYTPEPTKYVPPTQTPTALPGLGITRAEIQSVFSKPEYGYEFGDVKILRGDSIYKGQPHVMGRRQEIRGEGVIELIGSSDNLVHVLIAMPFPHNDKEKYDLNIEQMSLFLELAIPAWSGGSMWLEENFPVAIENGTISTQYNDISIEIKYYKNEEQDVALVKIF